MVSDSGIPNQELIKEKELRTSPTGQSFSP